jgi:CTP:molybdopterin cytidylyltransferase MocA
MGGFKPLLDIGGKPALFHLLDSIRMAGLDRIIIVTGHGHERIERALAGNDCQLSVLTAYNADYGNGMFSSVKAGIEALRNGDELQAALLFPVDAPLVSAETIAGLIDAHYMHSSILKNQPLSGADSCEKPKASLDFAAFAVTVYKGKNGHPLLIPSEYFGEILDYAGEGGIKAIRNKYADSMIRYETEDEGCVLDMDTPEDYEKLLAHYLSSTEQRQNKWD